MLILIVDDIEKNRLLLQRFLKGRGYEVIEADSGQAALEALEKHSVDLVLMDVKMPGMSGFETTQVIKSKQDEKYLPIIFVTALSEEEALEEALRSGGDDFVTKPVNFGILVSKIIAHSRIRDLQQKVTEQKDELHRHNMRLNREHSLISHFFEQAEKSGYKNDQIIKKMTRPMSVFNGDTSLIAKRPNGGITVLLGDFTGHGLAAAVGTLPVAQVFYDMVENNAYIGDIARELNRQINILLPIEMFFAASLIELSAKGDRLMIWHAAMPDAYLYDVTSKEIKTIKSQHLPLGVVDDKNFNDDVQLFYVNSNNRLLVYTDGLSETENCEGEMMGSEPVMQALKNSNGELLEAVVDMYEKYSEGCEPQDDISIIEIRCDEAPALDLEQHQFDTSRSLPWQIKLRVEDQEMAIDFAQQVINLIGHTEILKTHKGVIHTLISEMYSNALDHGVLDLHGAEKTDADSFSEFYAERARRIEELKGAHIEAELTYTLSEENAAELTISMQHNGRSFDTSEKVVNSSGFHGRGMDLIEAICDSVVYSDSGRCLTVVYSIRELN